MVAMNFQNHLPTGGLSITGSALQNQKLKVVSTLADADSLGALSYQWLRDGAVIRDATGVSYALTQDDVGHAISVQAAYLDGHGTSESVTSAATAPVADVNDSPKGGVSIIGDAYLGRTLAASTEALRDADGLGTSSYKWLLDNKVIGGAVFSTYTIRSTDLNHSLSVRVSYTDGGGHLEIVVSAPSARVGYAPDYLSGDAGGVAVADNLYGGPGNSTLEGKLGNDTLYGGFGSDLLDGGAGADSMAGGDGNDVYIVDSTADLVVETTKSGGGIDTVRSFIDYTLPAGVENLVLEGSQPLKGTGTWDANQLTGNAAANVLDGGGSGDTLIGGGGADRLTGGGGWDVFRFTALSDLGLGEDTDVITDFMPGQDKIDLSAIDADPSKAGNQAFDFNRTGHNLEPGQVSYAKGIVSINTDADPAAEYQIRLIGSVPSSLSAKDFIL